MRVGPAESALKATAFIRSRPMLEIQGTPLATLPASLPWIGKEYSSSIVKEAKGKRGAADQRERGEIYRRGGRGRESTRLRAPRECIHESACSRCSANQGLLYVYV